MGRIAPPFKQPASYTSCSPPRLPNNQWQLGLQGWFETGLAKFQQYIVDFVDNPTIDDANGLISVIAPTFIIISWFLPDCVNRRKDRRDTERNVGKRYAYIADGKLNLLRMALEGRGYDKWEEAMSDITVRKEAEGSFVPVQKEGETLIYPIRVQGSREEEDGMLNGRERQADDDTNNGLPRSNVGLHEDVHADGDNGMELGEIPRQN